MSKASIGVKKNQEILLQDAIKRFPLFKSQGKKIRLDVYNEFLAYSALCWNPRDKINDFNSFWDELFNPYSRLRDELDRFIEIFCFRAVTIYIFKIKFVSELANSLNIKLEAENLLGPHSFLSRIFPKGSSRELNCDALQLNQYSWYRPSRSLAPRLMEMIGFISQVSITEMMKLTNLSQGQMKFEDSEYSHAFSHRSFGKFLNSLLVFFPIWYGRDSFVYPQQKKDGMPESINTLFVGDRLKSLSQSHWLAQEENSSFEWSEILCPDFQGEDFNNGQFTKICHELQFLGFIVSWSDSKGYNPIDQLCHILSEKYAKTTTEESGQASFMSDLDEGSELIYDRVVFNLVDLPKKNPHHLLCQKVQSHSKSLSSDGQIICLSNQKLFVPSQASKVNQLLTDLKLLSIFNFEGLEGKGEIPSYVYIFKKKNLIKNEQKYYDSFGTLLRTPTQRENRESCLTFTWRGELSRFNKFDQLVFELQKFFKTKSSMSTPLYQSELDKNLSFEFHKDVIYQGQIVSSIGQSKDQVTHPSFFKNLTNQCSPLESFFQIESFNQDSEYNVTSDLLGITFDKRERFPILLVIDLTDSQRIKVEICSSDTYPAMVEKNGKAFYRYFGLLPKKANLNLNLFREFFESKLGSQVVQLSLSGSDTKMKGRLNTLLVPNFFEKSTLETVFSSEADKFFSLDQEQLLKTPPSRLYKQFEFLQDSYFESQVANDPWTLMGQLSSLKVQLKNTLDRIGEGANSHLSDSFTNPIVVKRLLQLESKAIYPKSDDVHMEFFLNHPQDIYLELESVKLEKENDNHTLSLLANNRVIIKMHSDDQLLIFIKFILGHHLGISIADILQLKMPSLGEFRTVVEEFNQINECLSTLYVEINQIINSIINKQINYCIP